jgi:hypothetical protein
LLPVSEHWVVVDLGPQVNHIDVVGVHMPWSEKQVLVVIAVNVGETKFIPLDLNGLLLLATGILIDLYNTPSCDLLCY